MERMKRVTPLMNYRLLGTGARLDSGAAYFAVDATNQPGWEAGGLVFLLMRGDGSPASEAEIDGETPGFLLGRGEYTPEDN
jgi:hypothetical protein